MTQLKKLGFMLLAICSIAHATTQDDFQVLAKQPLPNELGTFQQLVFPSDENNNPITFYVATLNKKYRAKIFQQEGNTQLFANYIGGLSNDHDFIVAINGGFYHPDFTPVGLFIENGKTLQKASRGSLLKACIAISKKQKILIEPNVKDCLDADYAMQTGPLLIHQGKINYKIPIIQENSIRLQDFFSPNKRTLLALSNDGTVIVITTSPATLLDVATILQNHSKAFGVDKIRIAVNLDGGSSTGMYIRFHDNPFYYHELKHVKTFVFFN